MGDAGGAARSGTSTPTSEAEEGRRLPLHEAVPAVLAALPELPAQSRASGLEPTAATYVGQQLAQFVTAHARFERETAAAVALRREAGERAAELSRRHPLQRVTWEDVRGAIAAADGVRASRLYATVPIDLQPQLDLVPIGKNPVTGLFEFYHLQSATPAGVDPATVPIPEHGADGAIDVHEDTGIVFALIPGAIVTIGAQTVDADAPYFDPGVSAGAHTFTVSLDPYFLARHELTQGQWLRLAGIAAPVSHAKGTRGPGMDAAVDLRHPVEMVDWSQCDHLLRRYGLALPTEAQWEHGCRAGTNRPYSFGAAIADLRGFANVLDQRAVGVQPSWRSQVDPAPWDDGFVIHAPVGSFPANDFGLHDMHGNVMEWCRDGDDSGTPTWSAGDGLRSGGTGALRALRGGSFLVPPLYVGCAWRYPYDPHWRSHDLGCRAARPLR